MIKIDRLTQVFDHTLKAPDSSFNCVDKLNILLDFFSIYSSLILEQLLFRNLPEGIIEIAEIFLLYFLIILLLKTLVGGEEVVLGEEGVADLIDYIHA